MHRITALLVLCTSLVCVASAEASQEERPAEIAAVELEAALASTSAASAELEAVLAGEAAEEQRLALTLRNMEGAIAVMAPFAGRHERLLELLDELKASGDLSNAGADKLRSLLEESKPRVFNWTPGEDGGKELFRHGGPELHQRFLEVRPGKPVPHFEFHGQYREAQPAAPAPEGEQQLFFRHHGPDKVYRWTERHDQNSLARLEARIAELEAKLTELSTKLAEQTKP